MADTIVEQLNAIPILSGCSQAELEALAEHARRATLPRGQRIITQGEPSDGLYILLTGSADVITDGKVQHQVTAGDIVGEISMLSRGEATASVVARSDVSALVLTHDDFSAAVQEHGSIALRVIVVLVERMRANQAQLASYNRTLLDYIEQVDRVTAAAAAVEESTFDGSMLDGVATRGDELGQLARVFKRMALEVAVREQRLRQEVQRLQITIDQARTDEQVAAITETDSFQRLERAAHQLRSRSRPGG